MKKILLLSFLFSFSIITAQDVADNVCDNPNPSAGISPANITVSENDGNGPCNMMDNDLATRWSAEGIGQEAVFDLGTVQEINTLEIAFFRGDQRTTSFDLSVSTNGISYTKVLENVSSNGNSLQLEKFSFSTQNARYLKYIGLGNSEPNNLWNSITELRIKNQASLQEGAFITTWRTHNEFSPAGDQVTIPTDANYSYNFDIDWGDGTSDSGVTTTITHTYAIPGTYQVAISGGFPFIAFRTKDGKKLISIDQWGTSQWLALYSAFEGNENMEMLAQDVPDLSKVSNLNSMFAECLSLKGNINFKNWDVSGISSMKKMFRNAASLNQDFGDWNIENVTNMEDMFFSAGLSTENYDNTLIGWSSQQVQRGVVLGSRTIQYCQGEEARQKLIDDFGWVIDDSGKAADCGGPILQVCPQNQLVLSTQQQVDDFAATYFLNCPFQEGIKIQGVDITNLNGLSSLEGVNGILEISDNPNLTDISGLSALKNVGRSMQIYSNPSLENFNGLSGLTRVGTNILISRNDALTDMSNLSGLKNVGGSLNISRNPLLSNCAIALICDAAVVKGDTQVYRNTGDCSDLVVAEAACSDEPEEPEPGVCTTNQIILTTQQQVDDFSSIYDIANCTFQGGIKIQGADITNLNGISGLKQLDGSLEISVNPILTDISGLSELSFVIVLQIFSNASLENLNALSELTSVGANVLISRNTSLTDISGLSGLTNVGGSLNISRNPELSNCAITLICDATVVNRDTQVYRNTGDCVDLVAAQAACSDGPEEPEPLRCPTSAVILNTQQEVDDFAATYDVANCTFDQGINISDTAITNLDGLSGIVNMNGILWISFNPLLEDISGLSSLSTVNWVHISSNPLLADISGLSSLRTINRNLQISSNASLENFNGLSSLESVGVNILIRNNDALSDLSGLSKLASVGGSINISRNAFLSNCAIALVCDTRVVSGDSNIYQNTGDCEDLAAAEASCSGESQSRPFITTWKTDNNSFFVPNNDVTIVTSNNFNYDFDIDWGDGSFDSGVTSTIVHTYATPGTYQVVITGVYPFINFNRSAKLISVDQWGTNQWQDLYTAFEGCENMDVVAQDVPDLSKVSSLNSMFAECKNLKGNEKFNEWDVSGITAMKKMFLNAESFNQDLGDWNVGNVKDMSFMLNGATAFNENISNYDETLIGWSTQQLQNGVTFMGGDSRYCLGEEARQKLIDDFGWIITDGGKAVDCVSALSGKSTSILNNSILSPNPATMSTTLSFENPVQMQTIQVFDVLGRLLTTYDGPEVNDEGAYLLNVSFIPAGTYFIKSHDVEGNQYQKEMVIIK